MPYPGIEKRRYPRLNHNFLTYYRALDTKDDMDLSQIKNVSLGGMLFTTIKAFEKGTTLALKIRLPGAYIMPIGRVIESRELIKGIIYDTRLEFSAIDENDRQIMAKTLDNYLKRKFSNLI